MNLCIYHGPQCLDGFTAAWVVSQHFPQAEFVPAQYGDAPPDVSGMDVIIVDFSYKREQLLKMKAQAKSLVVLDHHKTAAKELEGLDFCIFDMEKSGARLAWEFVSDEKQLSPWLVDYAEDADLWRFALPNTREVKAALQSRKWSFPLFNEMAKSTQPHVVFFDEGAAILRFTEQLIDQAVKHATEIDMEGHKVLCTNVSSGALISEVGHRLSLDRPFGVTYFDTCTHRIYSLRSTPSGIDVSEVAKKFGGGGHRNAAGFQSVHNPSILSLISAAVEIVETTDDTSPIRHDVILDSANGMLRLEFSRPVKWLGLDRGTAMVLAKNLRSKADGL